MTKWDIFNYVYARLHDPAYRERYAENLRRELPRIPVTTESLPFKQYARIGKELMRLHRDYEDVLEYKLEWIENRDIPFSWHVEKMRVSKDRTQIIVNPSLTLAGIPTEAWEYRLGNRSALDWIIDQYQVTTDKSGAILRDPNRADDPEYIVRLIGKVVTVSVETVRLVRELHKGKEAIASSPDTEAA